MAKPIYAYPIPGNLKSLKICQAFAQGNRDCYVVRDNSLRHEGDAFFYGVTFDNEHIWRSVLYDDNCVVWYCDNAYFDCCRQQYFRITQNALQHNGMGKSNGERFEQLRATYDIQVQPWREQGEHIVLTPQSDSFMSMPADYEGNWTVNTRRQLEAVTTRLIRVREWNREKSPSVGQLADDLQGAHALVTYTSAAAITAVMAGVPVVVHSSSVAAIMAGGMLDIEHLPTPDRSNWLGLLADNQFTLEEMRNGYVAQRLVQHAK